MSKREEIEAKLKAKEAYVNDSARLLVEELTSVGASVKEKAKENPWVGVGLVLAGGFLIGRMLGGKQQPESTNFASLADELVQDVESALHNGGDARSLVRHTLRAIQPIAQQSLPPIKKSSSVFGSIAAVGGRMLLTYALQQGTAYLQQRLENGDEAPPIRES